MWHLNLDVLLCTRYQSSDYWKWTFRQFIHWRLVCDSIVQSAEPFLEHHPFQGMAWAPCSWVYNVIFSSVYHISILSVTGMFITCFLSRCLITSVHRIGWRMDPSGLTRGPSLLEASVWDLDMLFKQSISLTHVNAIINASCSKMYCWWIYLFRGCV